MPDVVVANRAARHANRRARYDGRHARHRRRRFLSAGWLALVAGVVLTGVAFAVQNQPTSPLRTPPAPNLIANGGVEGGTRGWQAVTPTATIAQINGGHSGRAALRLATAGPAPIVRYRSGFGGRAGVVVQTVVWIKATPGHRVLLRLVEYQRGTPGAADQVVRVAGTGFQRLEVLHTITRPGAELVLEAGLADDGAQAATLDDAFMRGT